MSPLTMDELGQIQLPSSVQDQLGLSEKTSLAIEIKEGKIILTPILEQPNMHYKNGVLVVDAEFIDNDQDPLETIREERIQEYLSW